MKISIPKGILKFIGHIYLNKYPLFISYKLQQNKIKGFEVRQISEKIKPGDIIFRKYDGYLSSKLIPGFWSHSGLYVGYNMIIHSVGKGVVIDDIIDFCRTDNISIFRIKNISMDTTFKAIDKAYELEKKKIKYDYEFKNDNGKVYCTEMINICYSNIFNKDYEEIAGNIILTPDGLTESLLLKEIITIKH